MKKCVICEAMFSGKGKACDSKHRAEYKRRQAKKHRLARKERMIAEGLPKVMEAVRRWVDRQVPKEAVLSTASFYKVPRQRFEPAMMEMWRANGC